MRNHRMIIIVSAVFLLIASACSSALAAPARQADNEGQPEPRIVTVNGTGIVMISPDIAHISIGVQTESDEASTAVEENSAKAQAVMEALESFGIEPEDIRTTDFNVFPRQDRDPEGNLITITYLAQNTVNVTVRDLDQIGAVLDQVVQAGANNISGIQFDLADRSQVNAKALELAVADARGRAEILVEAAGVELGQVMTIDSFSSSPVFAVERAVAEFAADVDVPISPGQLQVTADVTVRFQIEG